MDPLLDWIGKNTGCDVPTDPRPALVELSPKELTQELYAEAP